MDLPEMILAHQMGVDPFGLHEFLLMALTAGGAGLMAAVAYARRLKRLAKLSYLRARRLLRKFLSR